MTRIVSMLLVACIAGCGLAEYQSRMDIERKRVRLFDEEDKALDFPIEQPVYYDKQKKEQPAWVGFEVFVRPPKEYDRREKDFTIGATVYLFRYPGPKGFNFFVAASKIGVAKEGVFLPGEISVEEFRNKVVQALKEYYRKEYTGFDLPNPPSVSEDSKKSEKYKKLTVQPEGARTDPPEIKYELLELPDRAKAKDPTHFQVYFHQAGILQVALVYQTPKKDVDTSDYTFKRDYSLKSLDLSEKAGQKRIDFLAQRRNAPPPPPPPPPPKK